MHKHKRLRDRYRFKGYEPSENLTGIFGDPKARVIHFKRREKNNLSTIWNSVQKLLRPKDTPSTRPFLRRHAHLPRTGNTPRGMPEVPESDTRTIILSGRESILAANKRLQTAYLLKEQFGQLWEYRSEVWARKFFEHWKASLRWQRLKPYEKFAQLIERHWDGIAAFSKPENKVSLGFVEGLNTKIRVLQRRAYGLCDEEYLRLKILTCMLPDF